MALKRFGLLLTFAFIATAWGAPQRTVRLARLAACQILVIDGDREGNFRRIEYALDEAQAQHADIALFPESSILGWENPDAHRLAQPIPGADSDRIADLARSHHIMIAIGLDEKMATVSMTQPFSLIRPVNCCGSIARSTCCQN